MKYSKLCSWYVHVYTVGVKYGLAVHDGLYIPFYIIPNRTGYVSKFRYLNHISVNSNNTCFKRIYMYG